MNRCVEHHSAGFFTSLFPAKLRTATFSLVTLALLCPSAANAQAVEIKHSFFVAGPEFTGIIDEDGNEVWDSGRSEARDGWVLPNGNILVTWVDMVRELTPEKQVVFEYRIDPANQELGTAQRLADGNTLIAELGAKPRLLEVTGDGEVAVEFALQPETDNAHMQTRMARKLANGNYLVPHLLAFKVKEYTPTGKVVNEFPTDLEAVGGRDAHTWPFTAIRLENGNTLVCLTNGNQVVEFDSAGEIVWHLTNDDLPGEPIDDACGGQRLPNGNTVITSYHAQVGVKLLEVTQDKKLVWKYEGPHRAHHFQILTTNGQPIEGTPLK